MDPLLLAVVFVLVVSFLSNVSPFVGASYTLIATLYFTSIGPTPLNFAVIVVVSAAGATIAKAAIYLSAFGFSSFLVRNRNIRLIGKYSSTRAFYLVLFVTALLPVLPLDDFIYIGAGATSSSLGLMSAVTLAAKMLKSGVEIALEFTILRDLSHLFGLHQLDLTIVLTAVFVVLGIIVYKVDWGETYGRLHGRGKPSDSASAPGPTAKRL